MSINHSTHSNQIGANRRVYQRLKLAISFGLRRQIFVAVCDDLNLRNQIAGRLHSSLTAKSDSALPQANATAYPRLVTLRLNLADPNPISQVNQWLSRNPPPLLNGSNTGRRLNVPAFQILGIEQLTREPVAVQRLFLNYLRLIEHSLATLESGLLLWLPRPWLHSIQQSAPQFWRCRTGVFIFAGEPTPTSEKQARPERFLPNTTPDSPKTEDISSEIAVTKPDVSPPTATDNRPVVPTKPLDPASLPILSLFSKELIELVLETINIASATADNDLNIQTQNKQSQEIIQILEELHTQKTDPPTIAIAYQQLGNLYRDRIEQGQSTLENLMVAILAYQEAITFDETSPQVPDILNDLGTLYWMLYRCPPSSEEGLSYIEQGIEFYKLALSMISPETHPETYARVQNNLGTTYGDKANFSDPAQNWQQAASSYSEALRYRDPEVEPAKYAATQNNLGTAYWHLAQHDKPVVHLKNAITSYTEALAQYNPQQEPLKYGMIQNNIGTAYWNLAQYEHGNVFLQLAIEAYLDALQYRTPATVPTACAATQNNLGTAYWHLANQDQTKKEDQQKYYQLCIIAYEEALALAHSLEGAQLSFDLFSTHNNLGLAYYQIVTDKYFKGDQTTISQNLELALNNHLQALQGFTPESENYQTTIAYLIKTIRTFHSELGTKGQNLALSKTPGYLLPQILPKL
jgi:tetratricopeptide (TPR) repeat protein